MSGREKTAAELDEVARGHEIVAAEYANRSRYFQRIAEDYRQQAKQARTGKRAAS